MNTVHGMYNIQLTDIFVRPTRESRTFRPTSTGNYLYHLSVSYTWRCCNRADYPLGRTTLSHHPNQHTETAFLVPFPSKEE